MVASATKTKIARELEDAWVALFRAPPAVVERVNTAIRSAGFPTVEWYDVLWALARSPSGRIRQRDLGKDLLIARYNLSRLIDRLAAEGLVERIPCPADARGFDIVLTDKGRDLRAQTWPVYAQALRDEIGSRLTGEEQTALAVLLMKLA
jgi:DNA-binding MarR family transcriptional regulator